MIQSEEILKSRLVLKLVMQAENFDLVFNCSLAIGAFWARGPWCKIRGK